MATTGNFEEEIQKAVDKNVIRGAALAAADGSTENPQYLKAIGYMGLDDAKPITPESVFWIASCTKVSTAVAVMQCVERGLVSLDEDVGKVLHEWASPSILTGFDDSGNAQMKKATKPITLRHLLTHSSGIGYDEMNPLLMQYRQLPGQELKKGSTKISETNSLVLTFEPGEGWAYGAGVDWAGKLVERLNKGTKLHEYMNENIWKPLEMSSSSFRPKQRPDLMERMIPRFMRNQDGSLGPDVTPWGRIVDFEDDFGGHGIYSCASDYIKVLISLLRDDGKLLKSESVAELFRPQLTDTSYLQAIVSTPMAAAFLIPGVTIEVPWNFALGGIVAVNGIPGRLGKGAVMWSGLPNSYWFVDREKQSLWLLRRPIVPSGDGPTGLLNATFQQGLFRDREKYLGEGSAKL